MRVRLQHSPARHPKSSAVLVAAHIGLGGHSMPSLTATAGPDTSTAASWRLHLLGLPCLERTQSRATVRLSPKDAALLAVVALDGPIAAEHVAAMIWPAAHRKGADTNLRQRLFRMRRDFGTNLVASGVLLELAPDVETSRPLPAVVNPGARGRPLRAGWALGHAGGPSAREGPSLSRREEGKCYPVWIRCAARASSQGLMVGNE
jgi:hypothetical protein